MPGWLEAAWWGFVAGGALLVGAAVGWYVAVPARIIAWVMAFGAGVLISALSFDLMDEAERTGGLAATAVGDQQPSEAQSKGSGAAIAIGALLDGIPESVVLGVTLIDGSGVGVAVLAAVFISNLPEGLSSAAGMKTAGRGRGYVFGVWGTITVLSSMAAMIGYLTLDGASPFLVAVITAVAAGAILAMVADTMVPEAFQRTHLLTGLITTLGFLVAFAIERAA